MYIMSRLVVRQRPRTRDSWTDDVCPSRAGEPFDPARSVVLCLTIVAAFQLPLARGRGVRGCPASGRHGGARAGARHRSGAGSRALHLRDHAASVQHAGRTAHVGRRVPAGAAPGVRACRARRSRRSTRDRPSRAGAADGGPVEQRDLPAQVAPRELIPAILADRSAALLCHGLAALDDGRSRTSRITRRCSSGSTSARRTAFGAFSSSLRDRGEPRRPARRQPTTWRRCGKAVVGEKVTRPERFMTAAARVERRPARVSLRHHRAARSAAARVRARAVDGRAGARSNASRR